MTTTPYVKVLASVNGGADQSGGLTIVDGDTVDLSLESTVGITYCLWEIYDYPTGTSTPSGWTADATAERFYYVGITPPQLDFTGVPWGKFLLRATGNYGIKNGASYVLPADGTTMRDESTALRILSSIGFDDIAAGETTQFYSVDAWIGAYKTNLRLWTSGLLPTGTATGQAAQWNDSTGGWELATGILFGPSYIALGGNAPTTVGLNLSNGESIQGKDAGGTERLIIKLDPTTADTILGRTGDVRVGTEYIGIGSDPAPDDTYVAIGLTNARWIVQKSSGGNEAYILGLDGSDFLLVGEANDVYSVHYRASTSHLFQVGVTDIAEVTSSGIDCKGHPLTNFHSCISNEDPAQLVSANGTPGYISLDIDDGSSTKLLSELGFPAADSSTRPTDVIGFRVTWRYNTVSGVEVADDIEVHVRIRYNGGSDYRGSIWQEADGDPTGVSESASANGQVAKYVTAASGAQYEILLTPNSGGAHTIVLRMLQHTTTARRVTTETWRGATVRNMVT